MVVWDELLVKAVMQYFTGTIVLESLSDKDVLKNIKILRSEISPNLGWHLYTVELTENQLTELSINFKTDKWYAHFWNNNGLVVLFKNKVFKFNHEDKASRDSVIEYGLSLGIPPDQLDFPITL